MIFKTLAQSSLAFYLLLLQFASPAFSSQGRDLRCSGDDNNPVTGYYWSADPSICVPGLVTVKTWFTPAPPYARGSAVWYAPHVMRATANYRKLSLEGFVDGVSLMSPSDIGRTVWLRRPGLEWEGPFLVVDCARRGDIWPVIVRRGEIVEVGFQTAVRWGLVDATLYDHGYDRPYGVEEWKLEGVEVLKMDAVPPWIDRYEPLDYSSWWSERVIFSNGNDLDVPTGLHPLYYPDYFPGWMWKAEQESFPVGPYDDWFSILFGDDPDYKFDLPNNYESLWGKWRCIVNLECNPGSPRFSGGLQK